MSSRTELDVEAIPPSPVDLDQRQKEEPSKNVLRASQDPYLVFLDEEESPKRLSFLQKCIIVLIVSSGALCSTFASSVVRSACNSQIDVYFTDLNCV